MSTRMTKLLNYEITKKQFSNSVIQKFSNSAARMRPGYTLIEMLITITIFSGLLIIVLGSFASSSSSSARVGLLRHKNEAARALIDQIASDFRYIQLVKTFKVNGFGPPPGDNCGNQDVCTTVGFSASEFAAIFMMHMPNTDPTNFVIKYYSIEQRTHNNDDWSLFVKEGRDCSVPDPLNPDPNQVVNVSQNLNICSQVSDRHDLLSPDLVLSREATRFQSYFSGLPTVEARASDPPKTPFLGLKFTVKPADRSTTACSVLDSGSCYKVETTLAAGQSS